MSTAANAFRLSDQQWAWIQQRVREFEAQWQPGPAGQLSKHLEQANSMRLSLLIELVHADLEFKLREGEAVGVEEYLEQFPELAKHSQTVAELFLAEYQLRKSIDPDLTLDKMLARCPQLQQLVRPSGTKHEQQDSAVTSPGTVKATVAATAPDVPGYRVMEELGRGGMGIVYRGFDLELKRDVAIKLMLSGGRASADEQARFRREAELAAGLRHPNVLQIYHVGNLNGLPYVVFEFASRGNLSKQIAGQPQLPSRAAELTQTLANAIHCAHTTGIIHRDMKPANVLICEDHTPKIADFGLAKRFANEIDITQGGMLLFTPAYAAPEQLFDLENSSRPAVDIYALGAILYELLTGRPPIIGSSMLNIIEQLQRGEIASPRQFVPTIPVDLETICMKCLEHKPSRRYPTAQALAEDLRRFSEGKTTVARPVGWRGRWWRWTKRNPTIASLAACSLLLLLTITIVSSGLAIASTRASQRESELRRVADQLRQQAERNAASTQAESRATNETIQLLNEMFNLPQMQSLSEPVDNFAFDHSVLHVSTKQMVRRSIEHLEGALSEHPQARARLLTSISTMALNVGMLKEAKPMAGEAIELFEECEQSLSLSATQTLITVARLEAENLDFGAANHHFQRAHDQLHRLQANDTLVWADAVTYRVWMALHFRHAELLKEIQPSISRAVELYSRLLSPDHPQTLIARLAWILSRGAVNPNFEILQDELLGLWNDVSASSTNDFYKAIVQLSIANLFQHRRQFRESKPHLDLALSLMEQAIGTTDHPILVDIYSDAAWNAHSLGDQVGFRQMQMRAIEMRDRCAGMDTKNTELFSELLARLDATGHHLDILRSLDRWQGADWTAHGWRSVRQIRMRLEALIAAGRYSQALEVAQRTSDQLATINENLEFDLYQMRIESLRGNFQQAALIDRDRIQPHGVEAVGRWRDLSNIREQLINPPNDEPLSLDEIGKRVKETHPDDWSVCFDLVLEVGKRNCADDSIHKVLLNWQAELEKNYRQGHPYMGAIQSALSQQCFQSGDLTDAHHFALCARAILESSLGPLACQTLDAYWDFACLLEQQGKIDQAIAIARRVRQLSIEASGESHPAVWRQTNRLALLLCRSGNRQEGEELARHAMRSAQEQLGPFHPRTTDCVIQFAECLQCIGDVEQARQILQQELDRLTPRVPAHHECLRSLRSAARKLGTRTAKTS